MVTGWRRAFCTFIPEDGDTKIVTEKPGIESNHGSRSSYRFGFFTNPSTPRLKTKPVSGPILHCRTSVETTTAFSVPNSPKLRGNTADHNQNRRINNPRLFHRSIPSSPKSPSSFMLLKTSLPIPKSRCGICFQSLKTGHGTAIFAAECSHSFHFPCISAHFNKRKILICPVCSSNWKEAPLLPSQDDHKSQNSLNLAKDLTNKPLRIYDDDEPLRTPTSGSRFIPIPESNENEEEENTAVELPVLFKNQSQLASSREANVVINNVEVSLTPEAAVVAVGRSSETFAVVLKVKAPARNETTPSSRNHPHRPPIDLVTMLDVSLSTDSDRLQMMKRAVRLVISSLHSTDRLSILAFSSTSKRLLPLRRMTANGRRSALRIVDALGEVGQDSCINDALKKAIKVLDDRRERNPFSSILLLSDGPDHRSTITSYSSDQKRFPAVSSTRLSSLEIPVHTLAFGQKGGASLDDPPHDALSKCVRNLLCVVAQDLKIHLGLVSGSAPAEIAAVYSVTGRPKALESGSVRIGNLHAEEEREFLIELKAPASSIGSHHVLSVGSTFIHPSSQSIVNSKVQTLLIPRPRAVRSSTQNIKRLRSFHVTIRAMVESRRLVDHNNLSAALHVLSSAQSFLKQWSSASSGEYLRWLEAELAELNRRSQLQARSQRLKTEKKAAESISPTSAWRAAEKLAKVAMSRKSMNRVSDLHGFENARF